jgi:RNA recognition motif-containing protein
MKKYKIFVGNLTWTATENEVRELFSQFGPIVQVVVPEHRTLPGKNRGFCFVEFTEERAMNAALDEHHALEMDGRPLTIERALPKKA